MSSPAECVFVCMQITFKCKAEYLRLAHEDKDSCEVSPSINPWTAKRKAQIMNIRAKDSCPLPCLTGLNLQGAAEIVLSKCTGFLDANGHRQIMTEAARSDFFGKVTAMAQEGLRTLCLSYRDFSETSDAQSDIFDTPPEEDLTACCIVGIKVPPFNLPAVLLLGLIFSDHGKSSVKIRRVLM